MNATAVRSSADVAAELSTRRARQTALAERHGIVTADLHAARQKRARALADSAGKKAPGAAEVAALVEELDSITAALALLDSDISALQAESATVAITESEESQRVAVAEAMEKVAELDGALREAFASISPAFDRFNAALKTARNADDALDRLKRSASDRELPEVQGAAEKVLLRRGALLATITTVRAYIEGHRERAS